MADLIITGACIITMDPARQIIPDGAIAITGGKITAIGATDQITATHTAYETLNATGKVMLPGLIDVHAHAGHGLIKTMGMDQGDTWEDLCGLVYTTASPPEFWYAEARLAALERLRFGVTCGVSLLGGGDTIMRTDDPAYGAAHCDGVTDIGTRSVVAIGPTRAPHPKTYATRDAQDRPAPYPVSFDRQMDTCRSLLDQWHGKGTIDIALLYPVLRDEHEANMPSPDYAEAVRQVQAVRALSRDRGVLFTQDGHWRGSIRRAQTLGLQRPHLYPVNMEPYRVIYFANGNDVDTVVIGGKVLLSKGKPVYTDQATVLADAQAQAEKMIDRAGAQGLLALPDGFWGRARYPAATA